jgi:hypothetical protein
MTLSQQDQELLALIAAGKDQAAADWCQEKKWLRTKDGKKILSREALEFTDKIARLGMTPPWEG